MSTLETSNGHVPDGDDVVRQAIERLSVLGDVPRDIPIARQDGATRATGTGSRRTVTRHPEDPADAYRDTAREVCDPEAIRADAVATGTASQALEPEVFERHLQRAFRAICRVRSGAITGPARTAGGQQLKVSTTTSKDVERIVCERRADGLKAERLEDCAVPRAMDRLDHAKLEVRDAEERLRATQTVVADVRRQGLPEDARPGGLAQWVRLPPRGAVAVGLLDIAITTVVLEPAVSDLIATQIPYGSFFIAAAVSASLIVASAAAGFALAAIRLPGRAVGALMIAIFGLIMLKLVVGLDALRAGSESGVGTLTAATLAACFVAALAAYAAATWQDFAIQRDRMLDAGTPLGDALDARTEARTVHQAAKADLAAAEAELDDLWAQVEALRDSAARADAAAVTREQQGIAADVEFATIDSRARTGVAQEVAANEEWAVSMAVLAYEKARAEELPEDDAVDDAFDDRDESASPPADDDEDRGLTGLQKSAIGALGAGAVGGLVLGPIALAAGVALAAGLLVLGARRRSRSGSLTVDEAGAPPASRPIVSPASDEDHRYVRQPDLMVAEHGDGGPMSGAHR